MSIIIANLYLNITLKHKKNDFAEISKNLARYKTKNNFVELSKLLYKILKHNEQCCRKF